MAKKATKTTSRRTRKTAKPSGRTKTSKAQGGQRKTRENTAKTKSETQTASYRVFNLPSGLKEGIQAINATSPEMTMQKLFEESVDEHLLGIVETLGKIGIGNGGNRRAIRVKVSDEMLAKLAKASQQTGLDQRVLLTACLSFSTRE